MSVAPPAPDILIVGAGPTGLTLAAQAHALGARVRIVERRADPHRPSRALAVHPRTLEVLRPLGIASTLVERGETAGRAWLHFDGRVVATSLGDLGIADSAHPYLLLIPQAAVETVLREHLCSHGVSVEYGVTFESHRDDGELVVAALRHRDGRTELVDARFLAGCDGADSTVRRGAGIAFPGGDHRHPVVLADVEVRGDLPPGAVHVFIAQRAILFLFATGERAPWRLIGTCASRAVPDPLSRVEVQLLADEAGAGHLRLSEPAWVEVIRLRHRRAARYRSGNVFLAGDAAHVHSPAAAQGMNTGIQDAVNLGWKLALAARGWSGAALLDSYEAERRPVAAFVLALTGLAFWGESSRGRLAAVTRTRLAARLAPRVLASLKLRAEVFRVVSQLRVRYPRSPAVAQGRPPPRGGPHAGDRLPDARVIEDGAGVGLYDLLSSPGFHLLLGGAAPRQDDSVLRALRDDLGDLVRVHRVAPADVGEGGADWLGVDAHYLIRPDAYIGYRAAGFDLTGLYAHLARLRGVLAR